MSAQINKRILITMPIFSQCGEKPVAKLKEHGYEVVFNRTGRELTENEVIDLAKGYGAVIAGNEPYNANVFKALAPELKVISKCGVGMDCIDFDAARKYDIKIMNTPSANTQATAEFAVSLALSTLRGIPFMDREMREGRWTRTVGSLMQGKTVGVIGLGRIGKTIAELLQPYEVKMLGTVRETLPDKGWLSKNNMTIVGLDELLKESDVVMLSIPGATYNMDLINKDNLSLMKKDALLVNVSRGNIVDECALYDALKNKTIGAAALDVFAVEPYSGPLTELPNVVLAPHAGGIGAKETLLKIGEEAVKNLLLMLENAVPQSEEQAKPAKLSDLHLSPELLEAIINGKDNPALGWTERQIKNKKWIFPSGVDQYYDKTLWNLYSAVFANIHEKFGDRMPGSESGWRKMCESAADAAKKSIIDSAKFKDGDITEYVRDVSLETMDKHIKADGTPAHRAAVAIAYLYLYEHTEISQALAGKFISEWNAGISNEIERIAEETAKKIITLEWNSQIRPKSIIDRVGKAIFGF